MKARKTKIVCTIGPASSSRKMLQKLILAGMNVARLNFSHGSYEDHKKVVLAIRSLSERLHKPVAILQDLQGLWTLCLNLPKKGEEVPHGFRVVWRQSVGLPVVPLCLVESADQFLAPPQISEGSGVPSSPPDDFGKGRRCPDIVSGAQIEDAEGEADTMGPG